MKVVCTADYQGMGHLIDPGLIPSGDLLLVAGDICGWGTLEELEAFNVWLGKLPHRHKALVGGNHCLALEDYDGHEIFKDFYYLQDELVEIEGLKIYGSPMSDMGALYFTSPFIAFSHPGYISQAAQKIPEGLDILLGHGPAFGVLDRLPNGQSVGSKDLRDAVLRAKPKYFVHGHIHSQHGKMDLWGTTFINSAICSDYNQLFKPDGSLYYSPIVFDI